MLLVTAYINDIVIKSILFVKEFYFHNNINNKNKIYYLFFNTKVILEKNVLNRKFSKTIEEKDFMQQRKDFNKSGVSAKLLITYLLSKITKTIFW